MTIKSVDRPAIHRLPLEIVDEIMHLIAESGEHYDQRTTFEPLLHAMKPLKLTSDLETYIDSIAAFIDANSNRIVCIKVFVGPRAEYDRLWDTVRRMKAPRLHTLELIGEGHTLPARSELSAVSDDSGLQRFGMTVDSQVPMLIRFASSIELRSGLLSTARQLGLPNSLRSLALSFSNMRLGQLLSALDLFPGLEELACYFSLEGLYAHAEDHTPNWFFTSTEQIRLNHLKTLYLSEYHPGLIEWFFRHVAMPYQTNIALDVFMEHPVEIQGLPDLNLKTTLSLHFCEALTAHWKYHRLQYIRDGTTYAWSLLDPINTEIGEMQPHKRPGMVKIQEYVSADEWDDPVGSCPSSKETFEALLASDYVLHEV
ncbi:hypothetical protein PENSPDRAFT_733690 [Peniophora sp. CONT]|nr:hypothetical protein PENSPDRAFT_733690 [Peniophora sp. CONT]